MANGNIIFSLCSFLYSLLIFGIFFSRKRINNIETKVYSFLIICNIVGLALELSSATLSYFYPNYNIFQLIILKGINVYFLTWLSIFTFYVFIVSIDQQTVKEKLPKFRNNIILVYTILFLLVILLPLKIQYSGKHITYTYGPSVNFLYGVSFIYVLICIIVLLTNIKRIKDKKYLPLISFFILGIIVAVVQMLFPELIIISSMETFVTVMMYHTIENPDIKMVKELEVAKDAADKANSAKTDFLSSMSHEIRTPLNAIVGFSDCIMDADTLDEAKENAKDIVNASQTLLEIVNGILDISKIEAGRLEIVNTKYNAPETFNELAKLITPKMNEKGLDFSYKIAPDLPETLFGDHANIKKIVTNLLSNACKYTKVGFVHYEVNCVNNDGICKLVISVEDSGQGIKKENVEKLFTKFQRLEEDKNTTIEGTGLGLAITKQLIELMGGKIVVHTVYGEGSKFTVFLNQKIETEPVEEKKRLKTTLDLKDVSILMVDDTPLNLKVTTKLLEKYNANKVDTCSSGYECLDKIQAGEKYDIILLDDMMPKMSGVITLQKLKEIPGFNIPTIALTANAITGMREKYLADGFDDYLAKPIEKEQLIRVLNQILGRSLTEEIKIPQEEEKKEIPPVEEKVEEVLDKTPSTEETNAFNLIPVVDIDTPKEETDKLDRKYLEENGVDVDHALELLGDMDMYNMTISDFMKEVEEKWNRIVKYKEEKNMPDYAIEVHSLKSDSKYLGFMSLADISYQHELKSKENDLDFVLEHFSELEEEYHKILEIAKKYVESNPVEEGD